MPAIVFRDAEIDYLAWLQSHPEGFVLNVLASLWDGYLVLHKARCTTLNRNIPPGGYTERGQIKVCTSDAAPDSLQYWIQQEVGALTFSKICSVCNPIAAPKSDVGEAGVRKKFDAEVSAARKLTSAERKQYLPEGNVPPKFYVTSSIVFERNRYVVAEVLERANGICESCGQPAPFRRKSDGSAYLEVHHKVRLADGGFDNVDNAIAICPNCHRREHFA